MAIDFEITERINRPVSEVFLFLSDFTNMVNWNYFVQRVSKISPGEVGVGSIFEMKRPKDLYRYRITGYEPPRKMVVELQPPGPRVQLVFNLHAEGQQTKLIYEWHVDLANFGMLKFVPGWIKRLIIAIPRRIVMTRTRPAVGENVKKLKELLETGQTTLQDGRRIALPG